MSVTSANPNGPPSESWYVKTLPSIIPPVAGGMAIIPVYWGIERKSALQNIKPVPSFTVTQALVAGSKAAPIISGIIGAQMGAQIVTENTLTRCFNKGEKPGIGVTVLSSVTVGAISSPFLTIFNGKSMGMNWIESLRAMSIYQVAMIVSRETSFLISIRISDPLNDKLKESLGESRKVKYTSAFISGVLGSLFGHMADTGLTCAQNKVPVTTFRHLWRGSGTRSLTLGTFNVLYSVLNDALVILGRSLG
ncbi:MAG: hypothetical protein WC222_08670 [Parachlamydiales bacterium]